MVNRSICNKMFSAILAMILTHFLVTGIARNLDWEGFKVEKSRDVSLVKFIGDVIGMTSLK